MHEIKLSLTTKEMETLLSVTAGMAHAHEEADALWRKVSKEVTKQLPLKTGDN
jgi:hypothetical protein